MRMKIHGATPAHGENSLCDSCRHSKITRGRRLDEELVICTASHVGERRITFKVTSCTDYDDQRLPSYYEFMQQAWIFQPGSRKRGAGFVRAREMRDAEVEQFLGSMRDRDER